MANWLKIIRENLPEGYSVSGNNRSYTITKDAQTNYYATSLNIEPARNISGDKKKEFIGSQIPIAIKALEDFIAEEETRIKICQDQ